MSTVLTNEELTQYVGTISESLNTKVDTNMNNVSGTSGFRKLIEIYNNGTSWYKVYAEYNPSTGAFIGNWCEQGEVAILATYTYTFLKPFTTLKSIYFQGISNNTAGATNAGAQLINTLPTNTGFTVVNGFNSTYYLGGYWKAEGYIN